jgi:L-ribulose-5-phosphate 3-epimerase
MTNSITLAGIGDEAAPDLPGQLAALTEAGCVAIELRTVHGIPLSEMDDCAFAAVAAGVAGAGLAVVCVDSRIGNWARSVTDAFEPDLDELNVLLARCAALRCRYVRVMSYPNAGLPEREWRRVVVERMRVLADRAEKAGVVLLHENCAGWAARSAARALDLLDAVGSPALRMLFDTGNGVPHGYSAYDLLTETVSHVAHVHVKDATGGPAATTYTLPGEGDARVADCLRLLLDNGYSSAFSLEPHLGVVPHLGTGTRRDTASGFAAAVAALRRLVPELAVV